jgi:hypothetical protein
MKYLTKLTIENHVKYGWGNVAHYEQKDGEIYMGNETPSEHPRHQIQGYGTKRYGTLIQDVTTGKLITMPDFVPVFVSAEEFVNIHKERIKENTHLELVEVPDYNSIYPQEVK